jgi:tripartite ATP-independent transporter DctM subunit
MTFAAPQSERVPEPEPRSLVVRFVHRFENGLMTLIFAVMSALPLLEIVLRKTLGQGIPSSSQIVQHLTLWAAFLGALLASREEKHLSLSTAELLPPGRPREVAHFLTHVVAGGVTALLCAASMKVVLADAEGTGTIIGPIPQWSSEVIMPIALFFMALRFAHRAHRTWRLRAAALVLSAAVFLFGLFDSSADVILWPMVVLIFLALFAGAPIYVWMSGLAMLLFFTDGGTIASVPSETLRLVSSPILPAIPLLTIAGFILGEGGAATRLMRVSRALIGWVPGGTAIMICGVCALFTAFTGGSGVTILALGGLVYPILRAEKYPEGFSLGLVTASGSLGLLFPPSSPVILYSVAAQIPDLNALYLAGLVPGALMILLVCLFGIYSGIKNRTPRTKFDPQEALAALWQAKWEIGLPIFVAIAFLGGWATIVEAAALACAYALFVGVVVFKDIPIAKVPNVVVRGATLVGAVLILLGVALGLTYYFVDAGVPEKVVTWMKAHIESQVLFLVVLNVMLLVLGSVFEIFSAIVILAPLVAPLGAAYNVDPIHLAIVFLANLELGFLFPPMGLNLFLSSSRFEKPLPQLYRNAFPFLCIMAFGVLLVTYVPAMTNGMLSLFGVTPVVSTSSGP